MALDGTYAGLQASVADWLHRSDLTAQIPDFIALAEAQMNRRLRVRPMVAQASLSLATEYVDTPDDFLEERSLILTGPMRALEFRTQEEIDALAVRQAAAGEPRFYTVVGAQFRLHPAPDQAYPAVLTYYQRIAPLSDDNASNWLLTSHPDAYLYGALTQAMPYMVDDERAALWLQTFATVLGDIQTSLTERTGAIVRADPGLYGRQRHSFDITTG